MWMALLLGVVGAFLGHTFAPKIAGGISRQSGAIIGGLVGLIAGAMFKTLVQIALIALVFLIGYFVFKKVVRKEPL